MKTVPEDPLFFINEANFYHYDCITRSPYIRALREYVNDSDGHFLVFEWMDNTLWETKEESIEAKVKVFRRIAKSCLKALAVFQDMDGNGPYVHAGRWEATTCSPIQGPNSGSNIKILIQTMFW